MMRSNGGRKAPRQFDPERRFSHSFPRFYSLLLVLLCSGSSNAWYQCQPIHQRLRPAQHWNKDFPFSLSKRPGKPQIDSLPSSSLVSFLGRHHQTFNAIGMDENTSLSRGKRSSNINGNGTSLSRCKRSSSVNANGNGNSKTESDQHGRRFGRGLLRRLFPSLLMLSVAIIFPGSAVASMAPATPPPIITCPVSAATEFRLMARIVIAALIGAALGKERSFAKHSAGVRTMSLVSMGAAVFTVCSGYGFSNFPKVDASRMAANVASGVGFVGAGVITTSMRSEDKSNPNNPQNNVVHGLTTAATIWLSAAVGVSCGVGLLRVATTAAATTIFILRMGRKKRKKFPVNDYRSEQLQRRQRHRRRNLNDEHDYDDFNAEIHVTTHWDEHHDHEPDQVNKKTFSRSKSKATQKEQVQELEIKQEKSFSMVEKLNNTVIDDQFKDPSGLMEEIVRSAWQNDNKTVSALVDLVLNRVEQREGVSKLDRNFREDDSSSSYLP